MAKKEKKISINRLESTMVDPVTTVAFTESEDVTIRRFLTLKQTVQFVDEVVTSVVSRETGSYLPEVYDIAFRRAVLSYFSNFNLPENVEKLHELLYNTRAYAIVTGEIEEWYLNDLRTAIDNKINFEKEMMASVAAREANELMKTMKTAIEEFQNSVGDVSPENISALVNGLSSVGQLDEEKLAKAVLDYEKTIRPEDGDNKEQNNDGGEAEK